jgi:hypothetical protein
MKPLMQSTHPTFGLEPDDIYSYFIRKYITLRPEIVQEIEDFYAANLQSKNVLAVHVRGSDKIREFRDLHHLNSLYYQTIECCLAQKPTSFIFLLTESKNILDEYKSLFKERLIYTNCQRTTDDKALFWADGIDKKRMGIEVLKDTYLAARCDGFIGNAHSNVSTAVRRLRQWPPGSSGLLSKDNL